MVTSVINFLTLNTNKMKNLNHFVSATIKNNGATYNLTGIQPDTGLIVAYKKYERVHTLRKDFNDLSLNLKEAIIGSVTRQFIRDNGIILMEEDYSVGSWIDKGRLYLDVVQNHQDVLFSIREGYKEEQKAIYDLDSNESFSLPNASQVTGTNTQQKALRRQKESQVFNEITQARARARN